MRLIIYCVFMLNAMAPAQSVVRLNFSDLEDYFDQSPSGRLVAAQRDGKVAEARAALQWRNPELEAEHEALTGDLETETENTLVISKSFMSPWSGSAYKKARQLDMQVAELHTQQQRLSLLADWKYAYVELQIKRRLQHRLQAFQQHIQQASVVSAHRRQQGTASGLDDALLQMSVFDIKATILHLQSEIRQLEALFKTQLGIPEAQKLVLDSELEFQHVDLSGIQIDSVIAASPHLQSGQRHMAAAEQSVRFAKGNILPDVRLTGGFKQVNDDLKGAVLGLSIPLPVLSVNRAAIHQAQADRTVAAIEYDVAKVSLINTIRESSTLIQEAQALLDPYNALFENSAVLDNLVFSFKEGWITLTDLFSGIEVYAGAIESYYAHLLHYYENIFQLEALTTTLLVQF